MYTELLTPFILAIMLVVVFLRLKGQPWIATDGTVKMWENDIFSKGCSQHIADWYTLSHIGHGLLIALVTILLSIPLEIAFYIAIFTGALWEIVEHTDFVLKRFRESTISLGYRGDSVLNSVSDYIFMMSGFVVALQLPVSLIIIIFLLLELLALLFARDNLFLATFMMVCNSKRIKQWQQKG